jgi:hypothetical protein
VTDERVGDLTEVVGEQHRAGEPVERRVVRLRDRVDEVVQPDGRGGHGVNPRLTIGRASTAS